MLDALQRLLAPAAVERLLLLVNHVLASEPEAGARLRAHAGKCLLVQPEPAGGAWPGWMPPPPRLALRITPAGLFEWDAEAPAVDLSLRLDLASPLQLAAQTLAGERPKLNIEGDAALAADVAWLAQNLRWDIAADLERVLPPAVVQQIVLAGQSLRAGLRRLLNARGWA